MKSLFIVQWNANGTQQHKNELELFLKNHNIDIMLIAETHLTIFNTKASTILIHRVLKDNGNGNKYYRSIGQYN